jgi:hypothetical protein
MENRTEQLLDLRPQLNLEVKNSTEIEKFQNSTLRPILKFQHDLFILQFQYYIKTDNHFKNELIGMVIGLFTSEELDFFRMNESELKRRISEMVIQRIQSVVEIL